MKTIGKVHKVTDLVSGESSNGQPWEKQTVVVEEQTTGKPRYLAVEFMGEQKTAKTKTLQKGDYVIAEYQIICNEYTHPTTGVTSWFTKLDGWRIDKLSPEANEATE
jgi:hypothetical protein